MTSTPIASAAVELTPTTTGFGRNTVRNLTGEVGAAGKKLGSGFGKAFALTGGLVAAAGVGKFLTDSLDEAREAQKVGATTEQLVKSTGKAAKLSAEQVGNLSGELSARIGVDDELIQSGANLLLTFKNVRNEVGKGNDIFTRATAAGADLAAAGFGSITSNAKSLGVALNDPVKGIAKLTKSGVTFTEQQKAQIKTLVASGDTLSAQKIILGEIENQVGGAAEASATAGDKAAVAFGNLKEQIGTALLPIIDRVASFISDRLVPGLATTADVIQQKVLPPVQKFVGELIDHLEPAVDRIRTAFSEQFLPIARRVGDFLRENPETVKAFAITLGILAAAIGVVTLATTLFSIALNSTGIPLVIIAIAALVAGLVYAYKNSEQFRNIVNQVGAALRSFGAFMRAEVLPVVLDLGRKIGETLKPILAQLGQTFRNDVLPFLTQLVAKFREAQPTIQRVIGVVVRLIAAYLSFVATVLGKVIPILIRFAGFVISNVVPVISTFVSNIAASVRRIAAFARALIDAGRDAVEFARKVKAKIAEVLTAVGDLPGKVKGALGNLGNLLFDAGRELISGLINGITSKASDLKNKVAGLAGTIKDAFPGSPVKTGPLRSWNHGNGVSGAGRRLAKGLADGLIAKRKAVADAARKVADGIRAEIATLREEMRSLASSVADAFKPDLFSGNLADFFTNGAKGLFDLRQLKQAFTRLRRFGLGEQFLSSLFASGNTGLILELASGSRSDARQAQSLFSQTNSLADQLGNTVGRNQFGDDLERLGDKLDGALRRLEKATKAVGRDVGREINKSATKGRRDGRK